MTSEQAPPAAATATERPPLRRSREDRKIAGVCGGLARHTGVDPIVFRILLAVLVLFGGVGAVLYIAGWLFLADDADSASPAEALLGRGQSSTSTVTTIVLAVIGAIALGSAVNGHNVGIFILAVVGVLLLVRHTGRSPVAAGAPASGPPVPPPYAPHGPYGGSVGGAYPSESGPPTTPMPPGPPPPPAAPVAPRERSPLGRLVISATLVLLGILIAVDRLSTASIAPAAYAALALGAVGAGLIIGTWYGRARGLIALGIVLCIALAGLSAAGHWRHLGTVGDRHWSPQTASKIQQAYNLGVGDARLDLTAVDFSDASVTTRMQVGVGDLRVLVPADVDVVVHARTGAGNLNLFGKRSDGTGVRDTVTDLGADGAGGGRLQLYLDNGLGDLEVSRD